MILVPNRLPLLSGNNFLMILGMLIFLSACSKKITAPKPVDIPSPAELDKQKEIVPLKMDHSIALLLPFDLNSINLKSASAKDLEKASLAIDFYQGFKIALDSISEKGHNFNLQVFDTQNQETRVVNLALATSVRSNDLIVGPVFPNAIKAFSEFSELGEKKLQISPLAASIPADFNNPSLVTVNNTIDQHARKIAEFISSNFQAESVNILLINTQKSEDAKFSNYFKRKLALLAGDKFRITERSTAIALEKYLVPTKNNLVIISSSDRLFVLPTIDKLYNLLTNQKYKIEVFGHPNWLKANYLSQEKMQALNSRISASYFVNYKSQPVKNFIAHYRDEFGFEPSEYSFKGFDIGFYFGSLLEKYGSDYASHLKDTIYRGLHTNFKFSRSPKSGYMNTELMMLRYKNFELQPEK
jgi:ABC-type branched-subunit amino acid transport system substrate-binding protein